MNQPIMIIYSLNILILLIYLAMTWEKELWSHVASQGSNEVNIKLAILLIWKCATEIDNGFAWSICDQTLSDYMIINFGDTNMR